MKKGYIAAYIVNAKTLNEMAEQVAGHKEFESRELWLDFETWLYKNHGKTLPDLSWNKYIQYSKSYNNERKNA